MRADGFKGDVKILTSCPACLQGLSRAYDDDAGTQADYIVVENGQHLLGDNWMAITSAKPTPAESSAFALIDSCGHRPPTVK